MLNERASKNKTCLHARLKYLKKAPEYLLLDRNAIREAEDQSHGLHRQENALTSLGIERRKAKI